MVANLDTIRIGGVQSAKPTFERKASSKSELVQPCQGLSERHIEIGDDGKIVRCTGYFVQQEASESDGK